MYYSEESCAPHLDQNVFGGGDELTMYNTADLPFSPSLEQLAADLARAYLNRLEPPCCCCLCLHHLQAAFCSLTHRCLNL
jgi:hypothetical protein